MPHLTVHIYGALENASAGAVALRITARSETLPAGKDVKQRRELAQLSVVVAEREKRRRKRQRRYTSRDPRGTADSMHYRAPHRVPHRQILLASRNMHRALGILSTSASSQSVHIKGRGEGRGELFPSSNERRSVSPGSNRSVHNDLKKKKK